MPGSAAPQADGLPSLRETGLEIVKDDPRIAGGFSLPDLSDPSVLAPGNIPFQVFEGKASIARAKIDWRYRLPEESSGSVMIDHGLGAKEGAYSSLADFLASHGIAVAEHRATHYQDLLAGLHPRHLFDASRLLYQAPWGVIRDIQNRDDIEGPTETFDMVGHSLGGRTAVKNAQRHPDTIGNVVIIDSIGMEGHHLPGLALRLPGFFHNELRPVITGGGLEIEEKARLVAGGVLYFAENPWRGAGEIWSLSRARIGEDLTELSKLGKGTAVIASPQDSLVHTEEEAGKKSNVFVRLPEIEGKRLDHLGPIRHPEIYGITVIRLLQHLNTAR